MWTVLNELELPLKECFVVTLLETKPLLVIDFDETEATDVEDLLDNIDCPLESAEDVANECVETRDDEEKTGLEVDCDLETDNPVAVLLDSLV